MFKLTKGGSGLRRSGGGSSKPARVNAASMGQVRDLSSDTLRRPAFLPPTAQEQGFDSDGSRLQGLEKNVSGGGNH